MILPTHMIGRHLTADLPDLEPFEGPCALCGAEGGEGRPIDRVLTPTFADVDWLTGGTHFCAHCLRCLGQGQPRSAWIKNFSCLATGQELRVLRREDLWDVLMQPPDEPFVLNITFDHKKHMSFKSRVNPGGSPYWVTTDRDTCLIDLDAMAEAIGVMQRWYTVCRPAKSEPTWFTKDHILHGCTDVKRILAYGAERFRTEDAVLQHRRGDHALDVLVHALNKRPFAAKERAK